MDLIERQQRASKKRHISAPCSDAGNRSMSSTDCRAATPILATIFSAFTVVSRGELPELRLLVSINREM